MTLEQKKEVVFQAARKLRNITEYGFIAGGYPRDVILGAKPKDIDIFISGTQIPAGEAREALVDQLYTAFGQTWTRDRPAAGDPDYAAPANNVDNAFEVFYMATTDRSWEPLNVVFSRQNERGSRFDWSICNAYVDYEGNDNFNIYFDEQSQDLSNCVLQDTTYMTVTIAHAKRLREKFPNIQFKVPHRYLRQLPGTYEALIQGGIIDVPREIIPAEAEAPVRNTVGFDLGIGVAPGIVRRNTATARPRGRNVNNFMAQMAAAEQMRNAFIAGIQGVPIDFGQVEQRVVAAQPVQEFQPWGPNDPF